MASECILTNYDLIYYQKKTNIIYKCKLNARVKRPETYSRYSNKEKDNKKNVFKQMNDEELNL